MSDDRLDLLDYYELLQVSETGSADDIRHAFHEFARRFHPDAHAGDPEKQARASQIYRRGAEAYRILSSPEQRRRYDEQLRAGKLRYEEPSAYERPKPQPGGLEAKNMRARPFLQKALTAIAASDWKTAKLNLTLALNHEPESVPMREKLEEVTELERSAAKK